ncbi:hypothetical protein [Nocardia sp. NPDC052112]|uniref:hypothetical protein n=1 Tax=Nocardia sp. NPDC052112 TaxID=3155646 RepID=UPI003429A664
MRWKRSSIFTDPPVELTSAQRRRGERAARRAALDAQQTLTRTKKGQYRRYRATAGDKYLDWPQWKAEYLGAYKRGVTSEPASDGVTAGTSFLSSHLTP